MAVSSVDSCAVKPPALSIQIAPANVFIRLSSLFLFPTQGQKMLEGKAGMAAALSVMGSSAVSLPALAGLPHSGPSLQRLSEAAEGSDFGSSVLAAGAAVNLPSCGCKINIRQC